MMVRFKLGSLRTPTQIQHHWATAALKKYLKKKCYVYIDSIVFHVLVTYMGVNWYGIRVVTAGNSRCGYCSNLTNWERNWHNGVPRKLLLSALTHLLTGHVRARHIIYHDFQSLAAYIRMIVSQVEISQWWLKPHVPWVLITEILILLHQFV